MFAAESSLFQGYDGWNVRDVEVTMCLKKLQKDGGVSSLFDEDWMFVFSC